MTQASTLDAAPARRKLTYEEFLALDGNPHQEWVDGEAVPMVSVSTVHARITMWLSRLLGSFLELQPVGEVFGDPFNVRLTRTGRAPDLMLILNENLHRLRGNFLEGPPDIVIEVISPGSRTTDRVAKFAEYEEGGIPEYWLIDPQRESAEFYVLDANGRYQAAADGEWFASTVVRGLRMKPAWFWDRPTARAALAEMLP
ncbi:MAG: Uma2 family endonuclease [Dehalococcoidia bacterium]